MLGLSYTFGWCCQRMLLRLALLRGQEVLESTEVSALLLLASNCVPLGTLSKRENRNFERIAPSQVWDRVVVCDRFAPNEDCILPRQQFLVQMMRSIGRAYNIKGGGVITEMRAMRSQTTTNETT